MSIKILLQTSMLVVCIIAIGYAGFKWIRATDVSTSLTMEMERFPFPSLTICPTYFKDASNLQEYHRNATTLSEFYERVPPMRNFVSDPGLTSGQKQVNLAKSWNIDDFIRPYSPDSVNVFLVRCGSFNFDITSVSTTSLSYLFLGVNMTLFDEIVVELHPSGRSVSNHKIGFGRNTAEYLIEDAYYVEKQLSAEKVVQLDRPGHNCHTNNDNIMLDCMTDFIESELQCNFPWNKRPDKDYKRICENQDDFNQVYRQLTHEHNGTMTEKLKEFGCLVPNCETVRWQTIKESTRTAPDSRMLYLNFEIPAGETVKVFKEEASYGFASFVADFGGYMGLFLGASLLSLFEEISSKIGGILRKV